ncbi:uncharacterized protein LOC118827640 [Colossoma macropomum]|uniref:uncharacterized protein LOC118827640 n=1 Tax=Colossoma macropomum TaxID=42526 RepID=UPI00186404D9|nr:uncharacterized protein LOC118827640 [Colossoma macropomum]
MEAGNHEEAVDEAEDTDELLCTDVDGETVSDFTLGAPALPRDHCDLLLDAIDAHLSRLQTHSHGQVNRGKSKMEAILGAVCLDRSNSASKDTGLGSTVPSTDKATSTPDGSNSDHPDLSPVEVSRGRMEPAGQQQDINEEHFGLCTTPSWQTGRARGSWDSKSEQCLWRLEKLLGSSTKQVGVKEQEVEEEDSVCTEDFSARFREEMLEPQELNAGGAGSASDAAIISSSDTGHLIPSQIVQNQNTVQNLSEKSCTRHLAAKPPA